MALLYSGGFKLSYNGWCFYSVVVFSYTFSNGYGASGLGSFLNFVIILMNRLEGLQVEAGLFCDGVGGLMVANIFTLYLEGYLLGIVVSVASVFLVAAGGSLLATDAGQQ